MRFLDRREAGDRLAERLLFLQGRHPAVVAIGPGGIEVGARIAERLLAPLDVLGVEHLTATREGQQREGGPPLGAVAEDGSMHLMRRPGPSEGGPVADIEALVLEARQRAERRARAIRQERPLLRVAGHPVVLVDDLAVSGARMHAAVSSMRAQRASEVHVALPAASRAVARGLERHADRVWCLETSSRPMTLDACYLEAAPQRQRPPSDILREHGMGGIVLGGPRRGTPAASDVVLGLAGGAVPARVRLPADASTAVLLLDALEDGSDTGLDALLARSGMATLAVGPLLVDERPITDDAWRSASRQVVEALRWLREHLALGSVPVGAIGRDQHATLLLRILARERGLGVVALVARGPRDGQDIEGLERIEAKTLLLVDETDGRGLVEVGAIATRLECEHAALVLPGARQQPEEAWHAPASRWLMDRLRVG